MNEPAESMSSHRNMKPIPTDPAERRARVRWLQEHKVWTHLAAYAPVSGFTGPGEIGPDGLVHYESGDMDACVEFDFAYVNPTTERVEDDDARSTAFRIWIEAGPWYDDNGRWITSHDPRLDCGAPDMETALLELARLVDFYYDEDGKNRPDVPRECIWLAPHETEDRRARTCDYVDGFCTVCGFADEDLVR